MAKVRADKLREVQAGHDGTWVAHPALVPVAKDIFDRHMPSPNQLHVKRDDVTVSRDALISPCGGTISRAGFDNNVEVALRYTAAWLEGLGCVPIHHLMEDAATAEIARAQLWQWVHHGSLEFPDHAPIDFALFDLALATHTHRLRESASPGAGRADDAAHPVVHADACRSARRLSHLARLRTARLIARSQSIHGAHNMKNTLPTAEQISLDWKNNPRWAGVQRNYSADDVVRLRGTVGV